MPEMRVMQVPYDSGSRERRMGRGPFHLVNNGALDRAGRIVGDVESVVVDYQAAFPIEIETTFGLAREIAGQVRLARERGQFPLVLAGNCNSTVGAMAGAGPGAALLWFDGHGDFNTPETTTSGFVDGMPVAMLVGHCWRAMTGTIPGFHPLPERRVALVGARDIDAAELERFRQSEIRLVDSAGIREAGAASALASVLDDWSTQVDKVYLHIDMDVHDPSLAPANSYQPPGGPSPEEVRDCVRRVAERFRIAGASITAYDPDCDKAGAGLDTGLSLIELLAEIAAEQD